jgi:uncharacterized protein YdeI (YjbR/CyaY-like superfamily)
MGSNVGVSKSEAPKETPTLAFANKAAWAKWLDKHHAASAGVWVRLAKKTSGLKSLNHEEGVEVALCYGWIDGQGKGDGATHWLQRFTPRSKRSLWSKRNTERAVALIEAGRMKPAGLAEIERAKKDGRWEAAYDSPSRISVPADLQAALSRNSRARRFFESLDSRNRYAVLFRIHTVRTAATRARRIREFVAMLERGGTIHR